MIENLINSLGGDADEHSSKELENRQESLNTVFTALNEDEDATTEVQQRSAYDFYEIVQYCIANDFTLADMEAFVQEFLQPDKFSEYSSMINNPESGLTRDVKFASLSGSDQISVLYAMGLESFCTSQVMDSVVYKKLEENGASLAPFSSINLVPEAYVLNFMRVSNELTPAAASKLEAHFYLNNCFDEAQAQTQAQAQSTIKDVEQDYAELIKQGYFPELKEGVTGRAAIVAHAMAHRMDDLLAVEDDEGILLHLCQYDEEVHNLLLQELDKGGKNANKNGLDFVAEKVAECLVGKDPSLEAQAVYAAMMRRYQESMMEQADNDADNKDDE